MVAGYPPIVVTIWKLIFDLSEKYSEFVPADTDLRLGEKSYKIF